MYFILIISLVSGVSAQTINLNEDNENLKYKNVVKQVNEYPVAIENISNYYQTIAISIDNYSIVLELEGKKLKEIRNNYDELTDLSLSLSKEEALYLLENYKSMSFFERFKYIFKAYDDPRDALILGGISMGFRGEI